MRVKVMLLIFGFSHNAFSQGPYTASFVATLGTDTVIVETYNMLPNHLFGKAFLRYPQDQIGVFDFHFYPDGSIRHYSMSYMNPDSSYRTISGAEGVFCERDSCTYFGSWNDNKEEYTNVWPVKKIDFMGGWTPTVSLIEWNCMRLVRSGKTYLPLTLLNNYIGTREVGIWKGGHDSLIFGGPFIEYAKINATPDGRIIDYDGTGTPWNYIVTKHVPIDIDEVAKRLSKTKKIGIPSPEVEENFVFGTDTIKISYGRPFKRGRKIFGGIVPYDSLWRTGAGHPTIIELPFNILIGKQSIPKGKFSLYTIPRTGDWTLIFNTDLVRWPTDPNRDKDFAQMQINQERLQNKWINSQSI